LVKSLFPCSINSFDRNFIAFFYPSPRTWNYCLVESALDAPPNREALPNNIASLTLKPDRFRKRAPNSIDFDDPVPARVIGLLSLGRPPNIPRLVTFVIVFSIQRMFWRWTPTDVGKELGKVVAPIGAYRNSATAIVFELLVFCVAASANYRAPTPVFRRLIRRLTVLLSRRR
jgi:hypothetical protein